MDLKAQYIKLFRSLQNSDIWSDDEPFDQRSAWIDLLLLANHAEGTARVGRSVVPVKRGQSARSIRTYSARWRWSKDRVRRFLVRLEALEMIEREEIKGATLITIRNYDRFQNQEVAGQFPRQKRDSSRDSKNAEIGTVQNGLEASKNAGSCIRSSASRDSSNADGGTVPATETGQFPHPNNNYHISPPLPPHDENDRTPNPETWTPDKLTTDSVRMSLGAGFQITDDLIGSFRLKLADWIDKGYFDNRTPPNVRDRFRKHCQEETRHGKNQPRGHGRADHASLADELNDDSWIDGDGES